MTQYRLQWNKPTPSHLAVEWYRLTKRLLNYVLEPYLPLITTSSQYWKSLPTSFVISRGTAGRKFRMKPCCRCKHKPALTALWQVMFTITLYKRPGAVCTVVSPFVVCGLCAEGVKLGDYASDIEQMTASMSEFGPSVTLRLEDISDGLWHDPSRPGKRVPVA